LITQDLSEFALHVRAIMGYPIPSIRLLTPGATYTLKATEESADYQILGIEDALQGAHSQIRVFGKPETKVGRRMAVALSSADDITTARQQAKKAANCLKIIY
jgi:phosphoribosylglycinamide formyltransferase 2